MKKNTARSSPTELLGSSIASFLTAEGPEDTESSAEEISRPGHGPNLRYKAKPYEQSSFDEGWPFAVQFSFPHFRRIGPVILLLTNDLMFQSRVSGSVHTANKTFMVDRSVSKLVERSEDPNSVELVLIDLAFGDVELSAAIPTFKSSFPNARVLAFGPHVDVERLAQAESAGADQVMTRGQFDRDLLKIVGA